KNSICRHYCYYCHTQELTSSTALCRLLINRNAGLIQQYLPSMIIPSAAQQRS
ncbi:unnamed protein product, partial [Rotaria sordida]